GPLCAGTLLRTYTLPDACTNSASCTQTITVSDTLPPSITCPQNISVQCLSNVPPAATNLAQFLALGGTAGDNCDTNLTLSVSNSPLLGGICGGTILRTYTLTDACTNSASCTQTITVRDTLPPSITCPQNISVQCLSNVPPAATNLAQFLALGGTAGDNCDTNLTLSVSNSPLLGGICGGTILRTYTVTDVCTNSASCTQIITVRDTLPPSITCPQNISVQCLSNVPPAATNLAQFLALGGTAGDNCDTNLTLSVSNSPLLGGICGGTILRTYTVTDVCTNSASCIQTITVRDTLPPSITCPQNISVQCLSNVPPAATNLAQFLALGGTAGDNCDTNLTLSVSNSPLLGGICGGTILRTYTVTDVCTNSASCTQTITVRDTLPPSITCPQNISVQCLSNVPPAATNLAQFLALGGTAGDNCDTNLTLSVSNSPLLGGICGGTILRTYTVTDVCTNSASCTQTITVRDTLPPSITCPQNISVQCLSNVPPAATNLAQFLALGGAAGDNCDTNLTLSISNSPLIGNTCGGFILRTYTVTDACTNSASCIQTITVRDTTAPSITCPQNISVQCRSNVPPRPSSLAEFLALGGTASDNCDTVLDYRCSDGPFIGDSCGGTIFRTHTVTDDCTNSVSCIQTITIRDTTPPSITCPQNLSVQCLSNVPPAAASLAQFLALGGTASDNCDTNLTLSVSNSPVIGGLCGGVILRTYTVTDDCTNAASCAQTITIRDTLPPSITCPSGFTVQCVSNVPPRSTSLAQFVAAGGTASDNCDTNLTYSSSDGPLIGGTCGGTITRTHTVTDRCTNSASCNQVFTIHDTTAPALLSSPTNKTIACYTPIVFSGTNAISALDNCDTNLTVAVSVADDVTVDGQNQIVHTRCWRVLDDCSNYVECCQSITIQNCAVEHCSLTQGAYGNSNGKFNGLTRLDLIKQLLSVPGFPNTSWDLVIGKTGRSLRIPLASAACIIRRLPAGGPPDTLPSGYGNQTLDSE